MTREKVNILHTSDVHLDNRIGAVGEEFAPQIGFMKVIDQAISLEADLLLIAGDLFDHNRVTEPTLEFTSAQLARLSCPVVMIAGNHDCLADYSIYHKYDPAHADHVHFIREESGAFVDLPELGLQIWGRGIVEHAPENRPLHNVPGRQDDRWYLGMVHGYYVGRGAQAYSSLITAEEIAATDFDYLALGHVHVFTEIEHGGTIAAYPGSPNRDQGARNMTAAWVELDPHAGVSVASVQLDAEMQELPRVAAAPGI